MKKHLVFLWFLLFAFRASPSAAQQVSGDTTTVDGLKILRLYGTHAQRGYTTGFLVGLQIKEVFEEYFFDYYLGGQLSAYQYLRDYFQDHFEVDERFRDEAVHLLAGMTDAGISLYSSRLHREMDEEDLLTVNAIVDFSALSAADPLPALPDLGCSSISSWGTSTQEDPDLGGDLTISRLLDWTPHAVLHENHLLVIHFPAETDEQNWLSFTYPGLLGALSAVNTSGVACFLNMGNVHAHDNTENLHPVLLSARLGLEDSDYDGDGQCGPADVVAAIAAYPRLSGTIIHVVSGESASPALVIESNNLGLEVRTRVDNQQVPGDNLVATNHFRLLYPPEYCYRYAAITDSLNSNGNVTVPRQWSLLGGAAGTSYNLQEIQFVPATGLLRWSVSTISEPGYLGAPGEHALADLFTPQGVFGAGELLPARPVFCYPNPFNPGTNIAFELSRPGNVCLRVYNALGRELPGGRKRFYSGAGKHHLYFDGEMLPAGVYFYRLDAGGCQHWGKMLLLR